MDQGEWESLILVYLQEKGYKDVEHAFARASAHLKDEMALSDRLRTCKGVVQQLVRHFDSESDPSTYGESFEQLSTWVDNTLDMYKGELSRVMYPVFLHCYLRLVAHDNTPLAKAMFDKFRKRLSDMAGGLSRSRAEAMQALEGVVVRQHLETNQFARQACTMKHSVRMSSYSHGLLMHFLCSNPQMLQLAGIINQHINLEVYDGPPQGLEDVALGVDADELSMRLGMDDADLAYTNQQPVALGLIKGNVEDMHFDQQGSNLPAPPQQAAQQAQEQQQEEEDEDMAGGDAEERRAKKKQDPEEERRIAAAAERLRVQQTRERVDPQPWLPPWVNPKLEQAWLADIGARAKVSPASLPSCCIFTFANARQTLNCTSFASDVTMLAAGFADSSVRLYDLTRQQQHQRQRQQAKAARGAAGASASAAGQQPLPAGGTWGSQGEGQQGRGTAAHMHVDQEDDHEEGPPGVTYLYGHTGPVFAVDVADVSHGVRVVLSSSADGSVRLWGSDPWVGLSEYRGHMLPVWDVAAGPLGYHFASASADRTARVWSTDTKHTLRIFAGHQADVDLVRWHPNHHYVATASSDRTVRLWDVSSGACVRFLVGLKGAPTSLALSPDGRQVAAGGEDGVISVWDLGSARRIGSLASHKGPVWSLAYSRGDGAVLASGGADETVQLWSTTGAASRDPAAPPPPGATTAAAPGGADGPGSPPPPSAVPGAAAAAPRTLLRNTPLSAYPTKSSAITHLQFSNRNLLLASGAFRRPGT